MVNWLLDTKFDGVFSLRDVWTFALTGFFLGALIGGGFANWWSVKIFVKNLFLVTEAGGKYG